MRKLVVLALALALAGCAGQPTSTKFTRMDGKPADVDQLKQDMLICRGEAQKASLSAAGATGIGYAVSDVYTGCLAGKGYVMTQN